MHLQGYSADELHVDEDVSLAQSTEFQRTVVKELNMVIQTMGGYNSENNGVVESPIKPIKWMIRAFLIGAAMPDLVWCFAFLYAIYVMNHC